MAENGDELYFDATKEFLYTKFPNKTIKELLELGVIVMDEKNRELFESGFGSYCYGVKSLDRKSAATLGIISPISN